MTAQTLIEAQDRLARTRLLRPLVDAVEQRLGIGKHTAASCYNPRCLGGIRCSAWRCCRSDPYCFSTGGIGYDLAQIMRAPSRSLCWVAGGYCWGWDGCTVC